MAELVGVCEVGEGAFWLEGERGRGSALLVEVSKRRAEEACEAVAQARPSLVEALRVSARGGRS